MLENFIKWALAAVAVGIIAFIVFGVFAQEVGATSQEHRVVICHKGETIEVDKHAAKRHLEQHEEDYKGECEVIVEEPTDYCDELEGIQEEACPPVEEPTCEELQNCPVEEPVVPPVVDTPDKPTLHKSQGPNGSLGDGTCQLEWKKIQGSKKVEIRYASDGVFGNGYKSFETKDDGAEWLQGITGDNAKVKFRGRDSKTEWSKAIKLAC